MNASLAFGRPAPSRPLTLAASAPNAQLAEQVPDQLLASRTASPKAPPGLFSLPVEILEIILEIIRTSASLEYDSVQRAELYHTYVYGTETSAILPCEIFLRNKKQPILSSLYSLTEVNKAMFELSRAWLWKVFINWGTC